MNSLVLNRKREVEGKKKEKYCERFLHQGKWRKIIKQVKCTPN